MQNSRQTQFVSIWEKFSGSRVWNVDECVIVVIRFSMHTVNRCEILNMPTGNSIGNALWIWYDAE